MRNALLTATKGMAVMHTNFAEYGPWCGDLAMRDNGSLLSFDTGPSTSYALDSIQARGKLFIGPGEDIYKGQVWACLCRPCCPSTGVQLVLLCTWWLQAWGAASAGGHLAAALAPCCCAGLAARGR